MPKWIDDVFGFAFRQPLYKTLVQMRIIHVSILCIAVWFCIDAWEYMKEYALKFPDSTWLVAAMPAFITANIAGLWAALSEARKSHEGDNKNT